MGTRSERKSGIELLRLVAILGIVLSHWGGHGSWELTADNSLLTSKVYLQLTQFFGEVGNCLFVLITGYFCAFREKIRKETIVRLVTDVKFYSLIIYSVIIIIGINEFTIGGLVTALFPFVYKMYWFILPYLVVFAISPWLNYILASSSKSTLYWFFGSLVAVELFFPIIRATTVASNVGLFILIYCVGAMLRRSEKFYSFIKKCKWGGVILGFGIAISSLYVLDLITAKISLAPEYSSLLISVFHRFL